MYAAVVQATVQTVRTSNARSAMDFLVSAASRYSIWHVPGSGHPLKRIMPIWIIAPVYATYVTVRLLVASSVQWRLFIWLKHRKERRREIPDVVYHEIKEAGAPIELFYRTIIPSDRIACVFIGSYQ